MIQEIESATKLFERRVELATRIYQRAITRAHLEYSESLRGTMTASNSCNKEKEVKLDIDAIVDELFKL